MINPERKKRKQNLRNEESREQEYGKYVFSCTENTYFHHRSVDALNPWWPLA